MRFRCDRGLAGLHHSGGLFTPSVRVEGSAAFGADGSASPLFSVGECACHSLVGDVWDVREDVYWELFGC